MKNHYWYLNVDVLKKIALKDKRKRTDFQNPRTQNRLNIPTSFKIYGGTHIIRFPACGCENPLKHV